MACEVGGGNKVSCREPAALAGVPALASGAAVAAVALGTGTLGLVVSQAGGAAPGDASAAALYVMPVTRGEGAGAGLAIATARRWSLGPEEALGGCCWVSAAMVSPSRVLVAGCSAGAGTWAAAADSRDEWETVRVAPGAPVGPGLRAGAQAAAAPAACGADVRLAKVHGAANRALLLRSLPSGAASDAARGGGGRAGSVVAIAVEALEAEQGAGVSLRAGAELVLGPVGTTRGWAVGGGGQRGGTADAAVVLEVGGWIAADTTEGWRRVGRTGGKVVGVATGREKAFSAQSSASGRAEEGKARPQRPAATPAGPPRALPRTRAAPRPRCGLTPRARAAEVGRGGTGRRRRCVRRTPACEEARGRPLGPMAPLR
jgi:hypothetical protein